MVNWSGGILLYVKHIWCSCIPYIYCQLEEGALVYVHATICENFFWCSGIPYIYGKLEGVHLPWVDVHSAIC